MNHGTPGRFAAGALFLATAFVANVASAALLDISGGVLTYTASAGVNNALTISAPATSYVFNDTSEVINLGIGAFFSGWSGGGTNSVVGPQSSVASIVVNLGNGTNSVNVVASVNPVTVNGGPGSDTVFVNGIPGALDNLRHTPTSLGAGHVVNDNGANPNVTFTGIEFVWLLLQFADGDGARIDGTIGNDKFQFFHGGSADAGIFVGTMDQNNATGFGPFALTETIYTGDNAVANDVDVNFFVPGGTDSIEYFATNSGDSITIGPGEAGGAQFENTIASTVWSRLEVFNLTGGITVNEGNGTNVVNVISASVPVTVNGGSGDDTVIANGNPGLLDNLRHTPTALKAGSIVNDSQPNPRIAFTGVEHLQLVLQTLDGDGARVDGTIGNDRFQFFHGATADAGMFIGTMDQNNATGVGPFPLTETTFSGDNETANDVDVNFFVPGGSDTFEFNGTANADLIAVGLGEAGGTQLTNTVAGTQISRLEVFNLVSVDVLGGSNSDVFDVTPLVSVIINVFGGVPAPPALPGDTLNVDLTGTTTPSYTVASNPSGSFGTFTFGNRSPVNFQEIESIGTGSCPVATCPLLQKVVSRKLHGGAGQFDLPLAAVPLNPTTEPRQGPVQTVVFTFSKPVNAATATITEGAATASAPTFSGNDVIVGLTGVTDAQYVTVSLTNVVGTDLTTGGGGTVRVGFLVGDVNSSRVVSVADLGLVNAQLAQPVTAVNFLKDVNASGAVTVADKGITNANLTHALPAP